MTARHPFGMRIVDIVQLDKNIWAEKRMGAITSSSTSSSMFDPTMASMRVIMGG
jgi:hypothetical protein